MNHSNHPAGTVARNNVTVPQCNYTIAPLSDSVPTTCDRPAVRRAVFVGETKEMNYCSTHWDSVKDLPVVHEAAVYNLVEYEC